MMITSVHHYIWLILILLDHTRAANNNQPVDNAQPPGTAAPNHIEYNGDGDAFGCQNMCYYYYCLGRSNYLTSGGDQEKNREDAGQKMKPFSGAKALKKYNTIQKTPKHSVADEHPPAKAMEGGSGAALIGHDTHQVQGGRMKVMWDRLKDSAEAQGQTAPFQGWVEPYNWLPGESTACNCKPNWPEHTYFNPYGNVCDCDEDPNTKYVFRITARAGPKQQPPARYEHWEPNPAWGFSPWNILGSTKFHKQAIEPEDETASKEEA